MKGHKGSHHRARGGEVGHSSDEKPDLVSGNPNVIKEAESRKRGGAAKKKHRANGGKILRMTGGGVRPRLDRPGRKHGGGVGADSKPLSSAFRVSSGAGKQAKNQEGGASEE